MKTEQEYKDMLSSLIKHTISKDATKTSAHQVIHQIFVDMEKDKR